MRRKITVIISLVIFALMQLSAFASEKANLSKIEPELQKQLQVLKGKGKSASVNSFEHVTAIVFLEEQADLNSVRGNPQAVIELLKNTAERSQKDIVSFLSLEKNKGNISEYQGLWIQNMLIIKGNVESIYELSGSADVKLLNSNHMDRFYIPPVSKSKERIPQINATEWNITKVRADQVWVTYNNRGDGIIIGGLDTGVDANHPDLSAQYRGGTNSWKDFTTENKATPFDGHGHGTHTTGTACGANGIGVAPNAKWIHARIFNSTGGYAGDAAVHQAFQWIMDPDGNSATRDEPVVVNNSWGSDLTTDLTFQPDVQAWVSAGIFPSFASGNNGPSSGTAGTPGNFPESFGVGATDNADAIASFSSRGPAPSQAPWNGITKPDVSAPGVSIRSSLPGGTYASWNGTSMATPHVTGLVALLKKAKPDLTVDNMRVIMESTSIDLGTAGKDNNYGSGRIDALAAVERALNPSADFTAPTVSITSPANGSTVSGNVTISADASDNVGVTKVEFYIDGNILTTITTPPYSTIWNSATVNDNNHTITARAYDAANNVGSNQISVFTSNGVGCTDSFEPNNTFADAKPIASGADNVARICSSTDKDYFNFNIGSTGNINVKLIVPKSPAKDYDVHLYNSSQVKVAQGINGSGIDENFNYNATSTGIYYVYVFGYSGAFDETQTYTLNVTYPGEVSNSVTVTAPNGGENWVVGSNQNITWTSTGSITNVNIDYSTDGGTNWVNVATSTANDGTHAWTVPNTPTTTAKVRISDASNSATNDVSNANFTISSAPSSVTIFSEGFEINAVPGSIWSAYDNNKNSGRDYWGDQSSSGGARVHSGSWSAYCADNSDAAGQTYDNRMNSYMQHTNGVSISGYTNVQVSFWIWYKTFDSNDYVSFQYYNGSSWVEFTGGRFSGTDGQVWAQKTYSVPSSAGTTFKFRWIFFSNNSNTSEGAYIDDIAVTGTTSGGLAGKPETILPKEFALGLNYPNPFNPSTTITFDLPKEEYVTLNIYNINGQLVRTLVNEQKNAGSYKVIWNGKNELGKSVASGVYIYKIKAGPFIQTKRMTLMK
jgi:hypothetical protein